ncbi:cytochrome d ubiquinol oxidase subunit II [Natrinema salifodinae]|uniref:Cytochrome bd-I ubiquinol oxidase subunit 2 apoprotein n=1 Tax=Natrinema salifodinae TaxID=1202768 RepID=A0A1I0PGE4_9EURY|nr:cytochrome d ubiquinol oxidase subunit II [Natrinema salifodinae]SEW12726.1 cytochrome bd-I ubiquinol oxidase subunit 2 apoprotein [Natrinema salifodinae]
MTEPAGQALAAVAALGPLAGSLPVDLPTLWVVVVFAFLGTFLFLDGFDFGAGALFALRRDEAERERILAAIGPFWDGNEVWLVVFGGGLFAAFPPLYAALFSRHYLLLFAVLGALICRGLAPEFYEQREDDAWRRWWGRAFVVGSVATPFLLGIFVGNWLLGTTVTAAPETVLVGLALVALTVVTGGAFLALKTDGALAAAARTWGLRALAAFLPLTVAVLLALAARPTVRDALFAPFPLALVAATVAVGGGYALAIRRGRDLIAFLAAGGLTYALVALVAALLYPTLDPATGLTAAEAAISPLALRLLTLSAALLVPLVCAYFAILYSTFSGPVEAEGY